MLRFVTVRALVTKARYLRGERFRGRKQAVNMKGISPLAAAVVGLALSWGAPNSFAQVTADSTQQTASSDMSQRMQQLEKEVTDLRNELAALKQKGTETSTSQSSAQPAVQNNFVASGTSATSRQPATPTPSLSSLLGPTSFSGFVDLYYGQNFNNPASRTNTLRAFDVNSNQFGLNLVELVVDKQPDPNNSRTGYHIALGYGQAINAINGIDPGGLSFGQYLKEAYFSYLAPVGKGLQVDVGKFVTPHGAEVIETKDDWNYSRGLLFSYAIPFYHFGMRAKYSFNDKYAVSGYFVNGWNNVVDNNTGKTYGAGFNWNPNKKFGIAQNYMAGPEQNGLNTNWRQLSDTVVTYSPTGRLSFIVNYDYGRGDRIATSSKPVYWTGGAGYIRYALNGQNAIATRYEYYDDKYGVTTGGFTNPTPQHLHEVTGTYEHLLAHHILTRFEFRRDMSNAPVFTKGTTPVMAQNTATAGLVFMFDSREAGK
jgi:putative OmpL-like beta-barrel porin-2